MFDIYLKEMPFTATRYKLHKENIAELTTGLQKLRKV